MNELETVTSEALNILREAMKSGDVSAAKAVLAYSERVAPSRPDLADVKAARDKADAERKARLAEWRKHAHLIEAGSNVAPLEKQKTSME